MIENTILIIQPLALQLKQIKNYIAQWTYKVQLNKKITLLVYYILVSDLLFFL